MEKTTQDSARLRLEELKDLYSRLFLLLNQSLTGPLEEDGALGEPIADLMGAIETRARAFAQIVGPAEQWEKECSAELVTQIRDYTDKLKAGLEAMLGRLDAQIEAVQTDRDRVTDELRLLHGKKQGGRAYNEISHPPSSIFDSKA